MSMTIAGGALLVLTGLSIMGFGLFLFYAWLPLLYAIVGFDIGVLIGQLLTGEVGTIAIGLGIAGAVLLGIASYVLEPYRRILLGVSGGFLFGLAVAAALNLESLLGGFFARALAFACGLAGGVLVPRFFNAFVIGASAISGASLVMIGAHHVFPGVQLFDVAAGNPLSVLALVALALIGVAWQAKNISSWAPVIPAGGNLR
jgi:hypothetical protein